MTLEELKEQYPVFEWREAFEERENYFMGRFEVEDAVRLEVVLQLGDKEVLRDNHVPAELDLDDVPDDWQSWSASLTAKVEPHPPLHFSVPWWRKEEGLLTVESVSHAFGALMKQTAQLHRTVSVALAP